MPDAEMAQAAVLMQVLDDVEAALPLERRARTVEITELIIDTLGKRAEKLEHVVYPRDIWAEAVGALLLAMAAGKQVEILSPPRRGERLRAYIAVEIVDAMRRICEGRWMQNAFFMTAMKIYLAAAGIDIDFL